MYVKKEAHDEKNMKRKKSADKKNQKKALFIQRLIAFLIDSAIVVFVASLLATPFVNDSKINTLNEKSTEIVKEYSSGKITSREYFAEYMNITYDLAKNNGYVTLISVVLGLIMFVIIPLYNNGQTVGKKLLKIRVISNENDLTINQLIFRAFIANSILIDLISIILIMVSSKQNFFYCYGLFVFIQYTITIVSIFMIMFRKDGRALHDMLTHTQVVRS